MSKSNPLVGLIGNYDDSGDESDTDAVNTSRSIAEVPARNMIAVSDLQSQPAPPPLGVHPAPITHCPWSACFDESSGYTYYWNHTTNAVTWEAPPEYLLALRLAQQQINAQGSSEVSAEEWQLYQQALAEKQSVQAKIITTPSPPKPQMNTVESKPLLSSNKTKVAKKRRVSDDEDVKIELITSYHNSDSESNDEADEPVVPLKKPAPDPITAPTPLPKAKTTSKKPKKPDPVEYGPALPPNQDYTVPIGPEIPPELQKASNSPKNSDVTNEKLEVKKEEKKRSKKENADMQDESDLLKRLRQKAKLLAKLGGDLPPELQDILEEENIVKTTENKTEMDSIDDMLNEIETNELSKRKLKIIEGESKKTEDGVLKQQTSLEQKCLFPSAVNINEEPILIVDTKESNTDEKTDDVSVDKKPVNVYLMNAEQPIEKVNKKKLRISNSVLPERKKIEVPAYTTKYSQNIEGFTDERTGLGFSVNDTESKEEEPQSKNIISYGNGLMFTKGEILNENCDEDIEDLTDLVAAKLKYLNQLQTNTISPVQEMLIQMQTLQAGVSAGGVRRGYWARWLRTCGAALVGREAEAAPPGWTCAFRRYLPRRPRRAHTPHNTCTYPAG